MSPTCPSPSSLLAFLFPNPCQYVQACCYSPTSVRSLVISSGVSEISTAPFATNGRACSSCLPHQLFLVPLKKVHDRATNSCCSNSCREQSSWTTDGGGAQCPPKTSFTACTASSQASPGSGFDFDCALDRTTCSIAQLAPSCSCGVEWREVCVVVVVVRT